MKTAPSLLRILVCLVIAALFLAAQPSTNPEHASCHKVADLLGATCVEQDGMQSGTGPFSLPKHDVVVLPSGFQIVGPTGALSWLMQWGVRDYKVHLAASEEYAIESEEQHVDPLGDGRKLTDPITKPSPALKRYYANQAKYNPTPPEEQ